MLCLRFQFLERQREIPKPPTPSSRLGFVLSLFFFFLTPANFNQLISTLQFLKLCWSLTHYFWFYIVLRFDINIHYIFSLLILSVSIWLLIFVLHGFFVFFLFLFYPNYPGKAACIFWKLWCSQWKDLLNDLVCLPWSCISQLQMPH